MGQFRMGDVCRNDYAWCFCCGKFPTARNTTSAAVNFLMSLVTKLTIILSLNDPHDDA